MTVKHLADKEGKRPMCGHVEHTGFGEARYYFSEMEEVGCIACIHAWFDSFPSWKKDQTNKSREKRRQAMERIATLHRQ